MSDIYRPGSLREMDRLIREIRNARASIKSYRSFLRMTNDQTEREAAKYEIFRALCRIEAAAGCLMSDAATASKEGSR